MAAQYHLGGGDGLGVTPGEGGGGRGLHHMRRSGMQELVCVTRGWRFALEWQLSLLAAHTRTAMYRVFGSTTGVGTVPTWVAAVQARAEEGCAGGE